MKINVFCNVIIIFLCILTSVTISSVLAKDDDSPPWPDPPPITCPAGENCRQDFESYRKKLETKRENIERERKSRRINKDEYRHELDEYKKGIETYKDRIKEYDNTSK